jgi:hypothetical protein
VFCLLHGGSERQRLTDTVIKEKKKEWVFSTRCMSWGTGSQCLTSEGLKILKLSQVQHPQILLQMEVTKAEVITYQTDTFDLSDWWKTNCAKLPAFTYVLSVMLTIAYVLIGLWKWLTC